MALFEQNGISSILSSTGRNILQYSLPFLLCVIFLSGCSEFQRGSADFRSQELDNHALALRIGNAVATAGGGTVSEAEKSVLQAGPLPDESIEEFSKRVAMQPETGETKGTIDPSEQEVIDSSPKSAPIQTTEHPSCKLKGLNSFQRFRLGCS